MYIYKITNKVNGTSYIGQTTMNIYQRFTQHCHKNSNCVLLLNAIQKYGRNSFLMELVEECISLENLNEREMFWIKELNTMAPNGYNLTTGGAAPKHSELTKQKMSETRKGREPHWATAASHNPESNEKRAAKIRGLKRTNETRKKMSEANRWKMKPIKDQYGNIYESTVDAAKKLVLNRGNIQMMLRGKRNHVGGFIFSYMH